MKGTDRVVSVGQSTEASEFLQRRVALFGLIAGGLGGGFFLYRAIVLLLAGRGAVLERTSLHLLQKPSLLLHLLGSVSFLAMWFVCHKTPRSPRLVRAVEVGGFVVAAVALQAMIAFIPLWFRPDYVVLLALTIVFTMRAVYVPSSARWTALVGAAIALPLLVLTYRAFVHIQPGHWTGLDPTFATKTPHRIALAITINAGVWWILAVIAGSGASRVIFGLRRQVRNIRHLGQYALEKKLGQGGMGVVYRASHAMLRRPTAIKILSSGRCGETDIFRFEREVQQTARLTHPNTVTVFDYGRTPDGLFYYAMELLDGASLHEVVEVSGPQPAARVVHILDQVASALGEAHALGLVHRDIKPTNIMLCTCGGLRDVAKVLDFGLVRQVGNGDGQSGGLTETTTLIGTPLYMAPEVIGKKGEIDSRVDVYALGAVAYFLLCGKHMFSADTTVEICWHHLNTKPPRPSERSNGEIPRDLEEVVLACLEKDPAMRPENARAVQQAVRRCADHGRWTAHDSVAWWDTHGNALEAMRDTALSTTDLEAVRVDLTNR